jgi:hypothetical protein
MGDGNAVSFCAHFFLDRSGIGAYSKITCLGGALMLGAGRRFADRVPWDPGKT